MLSFLRCTHVELLKLKRTPALMVALVAPYLVALLTFLIIYFHSERILPSPLVDSWTYLARTSFSTWCLVFLPIFTGLVSALTAAIEHRSQGFRHLFALPLDRLTVFMAKQITVLLLVATHLGLLVIGLLIDGLVLRMIRPELGFADPIPWNLFLRLVLASSAAAFFMTALQTWIALVSRSFALPIAVGLLATVILLSLRAFEREALVFYPWAYPSELAHALSHGENSLAWAVTGLLTGLLFAAFSGWSFSYRDT